MKSPRLSNPGRACLNHAGFALSIAVLSLLSACGGGGTTSPSEDLPTIGTQPISKITATGAGVAFSVGATGVDLAYQWQLSIDGGKSWSNISGATQANYLIALVHAFMNGWRYQVVVSGAGGSTTSSPVTLTLSPGSGSPLAAFGTTPDGQQPTGTPVLASDGNLYGTTYAGGSKGVGTIFKLTPSGEKTILHSFGDGLDGAGPLGGLVQGADGNLYGTTANGGVSNNGTVFKVTNVGVETVLYSFTGGADGGVPYAGVIVGNDGNLYGTTFFGGSNRSGTIFRVTPAGDESVLHSFGGARDGQNPKAEPMQAADGNLYGGAYLGGANGKGMIYKISTSGIYSALYSFGAGSDGNAPLGRLVQASDGIFYGTTYYGGANGAGTVFKLTPGGVETVMHSFGAAGDGQNPYAGLVQGIDGHLYGTSNGGGTKFKGSIFRITLAGVESVVHSFSGSTDGQNPTAGLVQAPHGALYGACQFGGRNNFGAVFEVAP